MKFTIFTANCRGRPNNTYYPNQHVIEGPEEFQSAVAQDHVCAEYRNSHRSVEDFLSADCLPLDNDNGHSDNPKDWISPEDYETLFPNVAYVVVPSRSDMKQKGTKSARPRHHVYFPIQAVKDSGEYRTLKEEIVRQYPFFDDNAADAARFLFGNPPSEIIWHEGNKTISDMLGDSGFEKWDDEQQQIMEGSRNSTMSRYAGRIIKRFGNTEEAYQQFLKEAERCSPPLEDTELNNIWSSAVKFGRKVEKQEGYIPPEEYNRNHDLKPPDYSDIGQAKALVQEYGDELVFTESSDYMRYDGIRWVESKQLAVGACEEFLDLQLTAAESELKKAADALLQGGVDKKLISSGGKALEKAISGRNMTAYTEYLSALTFRNFVMKRRDMKFITSTLQAARPMVLRDIEEFDSNEYLLNTPDATYDLRTGLESAREHRNEDLITKVTLVSPGTEGMDLWQDAVNSFFQGDTGLIEYVQRIVGYAAIGKVCVEGLIIAYGDGSNGKSTFWNTISRVLGNYSGTLSADALTVNCKRNIKPEIAELKGKRFVIASEMEEGVRLSTATVKQLCTTDDVAGEKKYKDPFRFKPTHTIVLYTNHLPKVGARDEGIWRRMIVIPFNARIEGKKDIKNYSEYLVEKAGSAVLTWIIEGARKAIKDDLKFPVPECVKEAIVQFRNNNDWLTFFLEECCEVSPEYTQKSGELYQEYRTFCMRNGEYTRSTTDFYTALETIGFEKKKTNGGIMIYGLRVKSEFSD